MTYPTEREVDDTARLILMDMAPERSAYKFTQLLRAEHPTVTLIGAANFWRKYMGLDREPATHDYMTGERL